MTIKEFKKMLKEQNHPIMKETLWMLIITIVYIIGLGSLLYLQLNKIIPAIVSLIFIVILILIAIPAMISDLKRDKKLKQMHLYYLKEDKLPMEKGNVKMLQMVLISLIVAIVLISCYIVSKYILSGEKEVVKENNKETFEVTRNDKYVLYSSLLLPYEYVQNGFMNDINNLK